MPTLKLVFWNDTWQSHLPEFERWTPLYPDSLRPDGYRGSSSAAASAAVGPPGRAAAAARRSASAATAPRKRCCSSPRSFGVGPPACTGPIDTE